VSKRDAAAIVKYPPARSVGVLGRGVGAGAVCTVISSLPILNDQVLEDGGHTRSSYVKRSVTEAARIQTAGINNRRIRPCRASTRNGQRMEGRCYVQVTGRRGVLLRGVGQCQIVGTRNRQVDDGRVTADIGVGRCYRGSQRDHAGWRVKNVGCTVD